MSRLLEGDVGSGKIYIRDFAGASDVREQLMQCHTTAEVRFILDTLA